MANADRPRGFAPYGKVSRMTRYEAGSEVFPGDAVKLASDGQVDAAAAGDTLLGVAANYASGAGVELMVWDDPEQSFVGQADETELDAQTDIGNNCDIVATAGSSTYKTSRMEVDSSTVGAAAAQVTILGIERRPDNAFGGFCDVVFRINEHQVRKDAFAGI